MTDTPETDDQVVRTSQVPSPTAPEIVQANFARKLERERNELCAKLSEWKQGTIRLPCEHAVTMLDFAQQTSQANQRVNELRAELEQYRALAERLGATNAVSERDELRSEVARLRADKARLDWLGRRHYTGLTPSLLDEELPAFISPQSTKSPYIRDAIDAAMKGAE